MKREYVFYMLFAALCTLVNLGSQYGIKKLLKPVQLLHYKLFNLELFFIIALLTGTILGFSAKFVLDKFIVFREKHKTLGHTFTQIFIYGLLAFVTTAIFWGVEILFRVIFLFENREIVGGLIGLAIGYTVKFFLDKRFVFIGREQAGGLQE
jgi:putative flippase GtrA